jgi:hypothetical protein
LKKKILIPILIAGALIVAAGFGSIVYGTVNATNLASSTGTLFGLRGGTEIQTDVLTGQNGTRGDSGGGRSVTDDNLAAALGITVEELDAAQLKAYETGIAQAVEQGLITQVQADELLAGDTTTHSNGRWEKWLEGKGIDFDALLADALGITADKLQEAYSQAYTARIDQAVTDGDITQEQADLMKGQFALRNNASFQSAMQSAYEAAVNQAVADGVITQAQADLILADASDMKFGQSSGFDGHGHGERGGHGGASGQMEVPTTNE